MADNEIIAKLGLDTSSFKAGIEANKTALSGLVSHGKSAGREMASGLSAPIESLEKTERSIGRITKGLLTGFGVVEVWKKFTEVFTELSEHAEKFGDKNDANIQGAIRWGKAYKESAGDIEMAFTKALGSVVRVSEAYGDNINKVREALGLVPKGFSGDTTASDNAAAAAEAREEAYKKRNDPNKVHAALEQDQKVQRDDKFDSSDTTGKENILLAERLDLQRQLEVVGIEGLKKQELSLKLDENKRALDGVYKKSAEEKKQKAQEVEKIGEEELRRREKLRDLDESEASDMDRVIMLKQDLLEINRALVGLSQDAANYQDLQNAKVEKEIALKKEAFEQKKKEAASAAEAASAQANAAHEKADGGKMSLQELANVDSFQVGASNDARNQGGAAREALQLRQQIEAARKSGNSDQAADLQSQLDEKTKGLTTLRDADRGAGFTPESEEQGSHDSRLDGLIAKRDAAKDAMKDMRGGIPSDLDGIKGKMSGALNGIGTKSGPMAASSGGSLADAIKILQSIDQHVAGKFKVQ